MQITRTAAVELLVAIGVSTATSWTPDRIAKKLNNLSDLLDGNDLTAVADVVKANIASCTAATAAGTKIEVTADGTEAAGKKGKAKKEPKAEKPAKEPKAEKPAKPAKVEKVGPNGVRVTKGRAYFAAYEIAKNGFANGINEAMVGAVDEAVGKANPVQTKFDLSSAWQAVNGFLAGLREQLGALPEGMPVPFDVDAPAPTPAPAPAPEATPAA